MSRKSSVLGACVAAAVIGATALPAKASDPSRFNWSGVYVGGHAGYAWGEGAANWAAAAPIGTLAGIAVVHRPDGFTGGGQIGANWQMGSWVLGLEASLTVGDLAESRPYFDPTVPVTLNVSTSTDVKWMALITPRIGYAWNNWLGYVKGGYAAADISSTVTATGAVGGAAVDVGIRHDQRFGGWTIGGGIEHGLTSNIIVGLQYDYVDFGSKSASGTVITPRGAVPYQFDVDPHLHMVTGRLSFKFN